MSKPTPCPSCDRPKASLYAATCVVCYRARRSAAIACDVEGCDRRHIAKGLCQFHRDRAARGLPLDNVRLRGGSGFKRGETPCTVPGCARLTFNGRTGLCSMHDTRRRKTGNVGTAAPKRDGRSTNWHVDKFGYVRRRRNGKWQTQHRLVVEQEIGRPLLGFENVHHINGDKTDNRPENLEIWNTHQPRGQRVPDKVAWAKEILALYEPEALTAGQQLRLAV